MEEDQQLEVGDGIFLKVGRKMGKFPVDIVVCVWMTRIKCIKGPNGTKVT